MTVSDTFDLLDWKRRIFDLYARVRAHDEPLRAWELWRATRDEMFKMHPQSPVPEARRDTFAGIDLFDYDAAFRVMGTVRDATEEHYAIPTSDDGTMRFTRIGICEFAFDGEPSELELYWLDAYGGGLFLPFRDALSGKETYGAGRYLLDTVKGADLGTSGDKIVLDFNFAYNPSCAHDPRWVCPLAPPANRLRQAIRAGEKVPAGPGH
ncbi:MAG: DUF1684 domain-containing protein [Actinomycetota bacterium]